MRDLAVYCGANAATDQHFERFAIAPARKPCTAGLSGLVRRQPLALAALALR